MSQKILIDGSNETQTQFALLSDNELEDFEFESTSKKNLKGNIYLGKVSRIEASLQAAFVDIGSEKNGFLAFGEIHPNYFQIPVADKEALIEAEAQAEIEHNNDNEDNPNNEIETKITEKIEISDENGHISIVINDSGIGFGNFTHNIKDVLNPYFTTKKNGTGLGLSIVNKIINDHNGKLNFVSIPNGAKIKITF